MSPKVRKHFARSPRHLGYQTNDAREPPPMLARAKATVM
jgi:hypothetical protein